MTLLENEQLLVSNFSGTDYALIEKNFDFITNHTRLLSSYIKKNILQKNNYQTFLDIGAGPGYITERLVSFFDQTTVLDPNEEYLPFYEKINLRKSLEIIIGNFQSIDFFDCYDFILCSHVLYHIPQKDWPEILKKIFFLLKPKGTALVSMVAPRGKFHKLCKSINNTYSNSQKVIDFLNQYIASYKLSRKTCKYKSKCKMQFTRLLEMFVIDDCFTPKQYQNLSKHQKELIFKQILDFVDLCQTQNGFYEFSTEEDYIHILKD